MPECTKKMVSIGLFGFSNSIRTGRLTDFNVASARKIGRRERSEELI
jgi:hypothetical protein